MTRAARQAEPLKYRNMNMSWHGHISRTDTIRGEITEPWGWTLAISASEDGPRKLYVTARMARQGEPVPPWEDTFPLHEARAPGWVYQMMGTLDRGADGVWRGVLEDDGGWHLDVVGTVKGAGNIALVGTVRARTAAGVLA